MSIQEYYQGNESFRFLPLHLAICSETVCLEIVQYLVEQWPESLKILIENGRVALHLACKNCMSSTIVQYLADQWPEAVQIMTNGDLPLHIACGTSGTSIDTVTHLIKMRPELVQVRNEYRYLPLHAACCLTRNESKRQYKMTSLH